MKRPEILAPAGNMNCLKAAILAGCDAVYLGGYMFGARAFSNNFSNEELIEAIKYAHMYNVKVYVTTNTIIYENEVNRFLEYVEFLYNNNVDAVIIQDIGMMDLVRQTFPNLDVHASTQMHLHNLEGAKLTQNLGLTRCVLARETTFEDIKNIKDNTSIELEIFVHGALCISYSGQCLMSSLIGGRSGNRGTCAGSCRQKNDVLDKNLNKVNKDEYNLSTKDLNSLDNLGTLIDIGVDSLKIEGRMKSPEYVYLVVSIYKKAVDSYIKNGAISISDEELKELKVTFNRMYTKGFMFHEDNSNFINPYRPNNQGILIGKVIDVTKTNMKIKLSDELNINDGIRIVSNNDEGFIVTSMFKNGKRVDNAYKNDVVTIPINKNIKNNSDVLKTSDYKLSKKIDLILKNNERKVLVDGNMIIKNGERIILTITDGVNNVTVKSNEIVQNAIKIPTDEEKVRNQINKTGNTIYNFKKLQIQMDENVFINIKELNELRRNALDLLTEKRLDNHKELIKNKYSREVPDFEKEFTKNIYIDSLNQYNKIKDKDYNIIYASKELYDEINNDNRVVLKLPRVVTKFNDCSSKLLVGELGSINKYKNINTDFSLNVVNSYSIALLHSLGVNKITLSYELTYDQIEDIMDSYNKRYHKHPNLEVIVHSREEIMISKFNLLDYYKLKNEGYLKDRFGNLYPIEVKDDLMYIYNYRTRDLNNIDFLSNIGINSIRYNIFNDEDLSNIA